MSLDRPRYYPPANRSAQDFADSGAMPAPDKVVWHSTETTGWPAYQSGAIAPHLTVRPDFATQKLVWHQHFPFSTYARALVNKPGGVETNRDAAIQVEIVGTCDPATHKRWGSIKHLYMPGLPDWAVRDLAAFAHWCKQHHGVPFKHPTFTAYPASFGATKTRFTNTEWTAFAGHCGHQHVPENLHGDPGAFPISDVLAAAARLEEEDDMPSAQEIAEALRPVIREELMKILTKDTLVENAKQTWEAEQGKPMTLVGALSNIEKDTDHRPPAITLPDAQPELQADPEAEAPAAAEA